ncbi:MAG TPA: penicillin-binding transpeptidase domain-containing protein [Armatimonadaceae bacterium]|nr:penicillin-binding transpeptidase domain-containing protein [Armatimonadaceae bacterium]
MSHLFSRRQFALRLLALPLVSVAVAPPPLPARAEPRSDFDLKQFFGEYRAAFVLYDTGTGRTLRYRPALCATRFTPCSTFKIPNSLIGLQTGVLRDENHRFAWDGVKRPIEEWNRDHTLRSALRVSAVWYYQRLAKAIGPKRMKAYLDRIGGYGNGRIGGDDRITQFWLDGPLLISPDEQVRFLTRLRAGTLPFSERTQEIVRRILIQEDYSGGGAVLRAKTGTDGDLKKGIATAGWYVGYVTSGRRVSVFATHIEGGKNPSGREAGRITREILRSRGLLPQRA